ncbi:hypothetical protein BDA96_10G215700 [Sorghum bicolor]|uniref:Secreted protein n=1 Tax=Sorghum bicolor TaxID=4558 RepID=A0A921Q329_SORBI|nr:hypothetical protein BDA96_10G215500 [Sorghum bicolor]KAG0514698.1 hypothetical protein BDA96_10G215600 [Sorghum bicolor]KAG0514699.1 hypothetical protein BDA96_10G215700 [Sorghum bicolor]
MERVWSIFCSIPALSESLTVLMTETTAHKPISPTKLRNGKTEFRSDFSSSSIRESLHHRLASILAHGRE